MAMPEFSRTWWGQRFMTALESFTDAGRLSRGRSYARNGRIIQHTLDGSVLTAKVRGSINPYFGVYKEPLYTTKVTVTPITLARWSTIIAAIGANARLVTQLLAGEMPDTIERVFEDLHLHLLPHNARDFSTSCSCPDFSNPCKHIAGVCYLLAGMLDDDPFLLFELRGLPRQRLREELEHTPLGQILARELEPRETPVQTTSSYFTRPVQVPAAVTSLKEFWSGAGRLPPVEPPTQAPIPALVIKRQGDYPPFWPKNTSFIATMEDLYRRVRTKSPQLR
jgi:uncharacterized Zn finger protein